MADETISELDQKLHVIMDDLAKSAETTEGAVRAGYISRDVEVLAKLWSAPETRPQAEEMLAAWSDMGGLRKRIADHWVERAKGIVETGITGNGGSHPKAIAEGAGAPSGGSDPKAIRQKKVHPMLAKFRALQVTKKRVGA